MRFRKFTVSVGGKHGWFTHNTYTAGNGNFTSFISIPYCANHDLPSPTDFHFLTTKEPAVGAGSDSVISVTAVQSGGR